MEERENANDSRDEERDKCIAHFWRSASNAPEIFTLTLNRGIKTVALGSEHCIALGFDGLVYSRGVNNCGQLGLGDFDKRDEFNVISYLRRKNVVDIVCGSRHSAALTSEGTVYCWGDTSSGQCGVGEMKAVNEPARLYFIDSCGKDTSSVITQVACGEMHSLGLTIEGQVWAWGSGAPLGLGNGMERALTPRRVEDFISKKVISIACGSYHSMAVVNADGMNGKGMPTASPSQDPGKRKRTKLSTRLRIQSQNRKNKDAERSNSDPLITKGINGSPINFLSSESSSSESDDDKQDTNSARSELPSTPDIHVSVGKEDESVTESPVASTIDVGITKIMNAVMQPVSGMLMLTSSFTGQTTPTHGSTSPKMERARSTSPKMGRARTASPKMERAGSVTPKMERAGTVTPKTDRAGGITPKLERAKTVSPKMEGAGMVTAKVERVSTKSKAQAPEPVSVQVWTWGRGTCGQLGHGTTEDRLYPCLVEELLGVHIVKIVAGTHHSLALTSYSQVYAWGDNSHAQLGIKKNVVNRPRKVKSLSKVLVWDIAAGSHYSLFLGDSFENSGTSDVYVCGKRPSGLPMSCMSSLMEFQENLTISLDMNNSRENSEKASSLSTSRSQPDIRALSLSDGVMIGQMMQFRKIGVLRNLLSCGEQCICLVVRDPPQWFSIVAEMASKERAFYYKLALIWQATLEPLLVSVLPAMTNNEQLTQIITQICKAFHSLMRHVSTACKRLSQQVKDANSLSHVIAVLSDDKFFHAFDRYSGVHSDAVACGALESLGKDASAVLLKSRSVFEEVLDGFDERQWSDTEAFMEMLKLPLRRIAYYTESRTTLQSLVQEGAAEHKGLLGLATQWKKLTTNNQERINEAKLTWEFWQECPPKLTEVYKKPYRRVLKNSKVTDLSPAKQGRFSSHWFVLLNDMFIHIQSSKSYDAYDLATVWASPVLDTQAENFTNAINITTPEDSFTVCSKTALEKAQWLVSINQAVAKVISKTTSYRLSSETVNTKCGSFTPARAREASYFYLQDPKYKGACYTGMWLSGKPHGHGKMVWSLTAQTYEGEFRNGLYHGFGHMIFVLNASAGVAEEYEGEWKNGFMHGYGQMSYSNHQTYDGHWDHNVRHGHGVMRMGNLTSPTPSIFIGNWEKDKRTGFGVMDDIMRGEKYMGMWENDMRNGKGLIVTLDGIYNEGRFFFNKLVGHGVLLCDDNTKFEGEFCGDAQVNGKGVLTMPNGDRIEGTFQGAWNSGLRINGVYHKGTEPKETPAIGFSERDDPSSSPYYIPATKKWQSVFNECRNRIGCHGDVEPDLKRAWKCVSEDLARGPVTKWSQQEREVIDDVLRGVDLDQSKKIGQDKKKLQEYLSKAFDLPCHPLGRLLETLVDVYRATYVGMGAHSRLLHHAVEELKSYIDRVYSILRILFPNLPNEDFVHVGETDDEISDLSDNKVTDSNSLLGPLMFPRFYPPIFTLYALHNEKNDTAYWERVHQLNKRTDLALMSYLEIKRTFWLVPESNNGVVFETDHSNWKHTHYYEKAVETFQQISTKFSPMEKLCILRDTFRRIHKEVKDFSQGKAQLLSLDDLFPVFQFVVIRSRVHHLGSEISFIEDLMQTKHRAGELGHMFTTLKACYYQVLNEN